MIPINDMFISIDGEVNDWGQGALSLFIRTAGCNIRCAYCDTPQALSPSQAVRRMEVDEIIDIIHMHEGKFSKVTITGGEPLAAGNDIYKLIDRLVRREQIKTSIETNGTIYPDSGFLKTIFGFAVCWIFDYKLNSSGCAHARLPLYMYASALPPRSWIKFVIATEEDWQEASTIAWEIWRVCKKSGRDMPRIAFSPCMGQQGAILPEELIKRCISTGMFFVTINCQIHKFLLPPREGVSILPNPV